MDLLQACDEQIAQSEARIRRYAQLLEKASADPLDAAARELASRALESERAHKRKMEEMRAQHLERTRRTAAATRRLRVILALAFIGVVAALALRHSPGR